MQLFDGVVLDFSQQRNQLGYSEGTFKLIVYFFMIK